MPQDYYIILTTGIVSKVANVTSTPIVVTKTMAQGVYRDTLQNFPQAAGTVLIQGPGWTNIPEYTVTAGQPEFTGFQTELDDNAAHIAPRSLTWPESHWEFQTAGGNYYTPTRLLASMSTSQPTI